MEDNFRSLKPYLRGFPIIVLAMVISFAVAKKYLTYVVPMYESTSKLRLADASEGVPSSNLFKDFDVFSTAYRIAAEIEVLKSDILLNKVLDELDFGLEIYRKGEMRVMELYHDSPILIDYVIKKQKAYDKRIGLFVVSDSTYYLQFPGSEKRYDGKMDEVLSLPNADYIISLNDSLLALKPYLDISDHYEFEILSRSKQLGLVKKNMDVIAVDKDVPVIRISYKWPNPLKTTKFANKLPEVYIADYIENKFRAANITVDFLTEQIDVALEKLSNAEYGIQNYRDIKGITNLRQETETNLRKLSQLKIMQINLKMSLEAIIELDNYIKNGKDDFLELAPNFEAFTDLLSTEMVKKLKVLQAEKKDLLLEYTPADPRVQVIDEKIKDITSYFVESISNTRRNLETKYEKLLTSIDLAEREFIGIPEKERLLAIMNRDFQIYQQSYNFLNEKKIEAEIAKAATIAFHRVLTPAQIPKRPISPNKPIITIVSVILGMFGAIVLIYIVHMIKAKVNDKQTIETDSLTAVEMLTPMFFNEQKKRYHFLQEAVQLEIKGLVTQNGIVCFSAFHRREGASFNARSLAQALAKQGRRVLLIDVDNTMNMFYGDVNSTITLEENLDMIVLTDDSYNRYTKQKMEQYLKSFEVDYDILIVHNEMLKGQKSLLFMSIATANFISLDARLSPFKRIADSDLLKAEYNFENLKFVLNRYAFNPNVVREILHNINKFVRKILNKEMKNRV